MRERLQLFGRKLPNYDAGHICGAMLKSFVELTGLSTGRLNIYF